MFSLSPPTGHGAGGQSGCPGFSVLPDCYIDLSQVSQRWEAFVGVYTVLQRGNDRKVQSGNGVFYSPLFFKCFELFIYLFSFLIVLSMSESF